MEKKLIAPILLSFISSILFIPNCSSPPYVSCTKGTEHCWCTEENECLEGLYCSEENICEFRDGESTLDGNNDDDSDTSSENSDDSENNSDTESDSNSADTESTADSTDDNEDDDPSTGNVGEGAYTTGEYRNLFAEIGKSQSAIDSKVNDAFEHFFYGNDDQRIYYPSNNGAYIYDSGNDDVRSEGISYGMMIAVQMDKKEEFDNIWNWAKTNMWYASGQFAGWFGWQNSTNGSRIGSEPTPASDGDEYIAMSLFFASHRWGDGSGIYDYSAEANAILRAMLHQRDDGFGVNMFDPNTKLVVFCPIGSSAEFTDPSYHLPGFYELWAEWADQDNDEWRDIAARSREFLHTSTNPSTGLNPDYARFDGTPHDPSGGGHTDFRYDAWRVAMNIGMDYGWFVKDSWQTTFADTLQDFFYGQGINSYGDQYTLSGNPLGTDHSQGLVGCNAVAGLATNSDRSKEFTEALWNTEPPSGTWRYYSGLLYMMSLLHCSGNFRIW